MKKKLIIIKLIFTALFVWYINRTISFNTLAELLPLIKVRHIVLATFLSMLIPLSFALRWYSTLRLFKISKLTYRESLLAQLRGSFFAFFTPGGVGEFYKAYSLPREEWKRANVALVMERMMGTLSITLPAFIFLFNVGSTLDSHVIRTIYFIKLLFL